MGGKAGNGDRIPLAQARALAETIIDEMVKEGAVTQAVVCGSVRRCKPTVGDIDILAIPKIGVPGLANWVAGLDPADVVNIGTHAVRFRRDGVQVDVLLTDKDGWGAAEMHLTGPAGRNIGQRKLAAKAGLKLNEKGLWQGDERLPCSRDEREIYDFMGWTWREPKDRR